MSKKIPVSLIFAVADIAWGALVIAFYTAAPYVLPHLKALPFLSTEFLISLALPAFVLIVGITNIARAAYSIPFTFFVSFVAGIYSLTSILSYAPPYFLDAAAPAFTVAVFQYVFPAATIAYFALHSLESFIRWRKAKPAEESAAAGGPVTEGLFCAACQAPIKTTDEACPACGALLAGWHCAQCGYEGRKEEFKNDHCPRCGSRQKAEP